ncbi:MAG TPA: hypothetical protein PKC29_01745 [Thermodesulfobacteriota bacterium]|nr:hypothetical protein [Thermodesulfobacteriota bacterium]
MPKQNPNTEPPARQAGATSPYAVINIHGLVIECRSGSPDLVRGMVRPFNFFKVETGRPAVTVTAIESEPPYSSFPSLKSSFSTPRNIVFTKGGTKIIDYFGKGVVLVEGGGRIYTIYGTDPNFLQEAFYLLVLSLLGQYCDEKGILRIHALTFSLNDTAVIFSAQSGGGKSTMAFSVLERSVFKLISDDEALVDGGGRVLPLPLRMGTLDEEKISSIPPEYVYHIDRMEFGGKYFIDIDYWGNKLERRLLEKKILFTAKRLINGNPYIEKMSRFATLNSLMSAAVIGLGLYQGMEFVFNSSPGEIFSRVPVFIRRLYTALKLTATAESYRIFLGRDQSENIKILEEFLRKRETGARP